MVGAYSADELPPPPPRPNREKMGRPFAGEVDALGVSSVDGAALFFFGCAIICLIINSRLEAAVAIWVWQT